jgi:D-serine deaminase-like pyridoxal phosphate-dependent protein
MTWFQLSNEDDVPSPALLIFLERAENNLARMLEIVGNPEWLRPHVKTHKLGLLVARQLRLGITKFKCATIAEAEMCAVEGAADVLLAFPIVGPNIARFCELVCRFPRTRFATIADDASAITAIGRSADAAQLTVDVFLDLDCGMHRTGVAPGPLAVERYRQLYASGGVRAAGLHAYDGHIHHSDPAVRRRECEAAFAPVLDLRRELENAGLRVPSLIAGGSPTFPIHAGYKDRECSPGTTVLWDFGYADLFPDMPFVSAAVLLTRVISKPRPNYLCLDLGHKAVAAENPHPRVRLLELPDATAVTHSEEHLVIETKNAEAFAVGDVLHGIPRHICPTVALHSEAVIVRDGVAAEQCPIAARARRLSI